MYCAPSHSSNAEKQYAWARIRSGGRPQKPVPAEEKKKRPVRKAAAILRRQGLKPVLPNPKTGEPRETDLKVGHHKSERPQLWDREAAVQPSVELAITSRLF